MLISRAELRLMRGIIWRPVAISLVYDSSGAVVYRDDKPLLKLMWHQLGSSGHFCKWIRYDVRSCGQVIDVSWRSSGNKLLWLLKEVKGCLDSKNEK